MKDFLNKKILITGAASGIGKATAYYLSKKGAQVVAVDLNEEALLAMEDDFKQNGLRMISVVGNLLDDNLEYIFKKGTEDGVKLTGLVHCAGVSCILPLKGLNKERLHKVMNVNFYSFVELTRCFAMKKYSAGGSIVGISSLAAIRPRAYELAYITSKAALNSAIECLAIELASKHIRVNGIMPGVVNTTMISAQQTDEQKMFIETMTSQCLLGAAEPEQISAVAAFLLSDSSSIITGRIIPADGGLF